SLGGQEPVAMLRFGRGRDKPSETEHRPPRAAPARRRPRMPPPPRPKAWAGRIGPSGRKNPSVGGRGELIQCPTTFRLAVLLRGLRHEPRGLPPRPPRRPAPRPNLRRPPPGRPRPRRLRPTRAPGGRRDPRRQDR